MAGEKTEKATPKRKEEERKKGNVFQSKELVTIASLLALFYGLQLLGPFMLTQLETSTKTTLGLAATMPPPSEATALRGIFVMFIKTFGFAVMPILMISCLIAIVGTMAQTKMLVSGKAMEFKFSRLNPLEGIKRMFSMRSVIELVKAMLKVILMGYFVYSKFVEYMPQFLHLMDMEPIRAMGVVGEFIMSLVNIAGVVFLFLAVADYVYQWWDYEKKLRMSKDEIKEEYKQTEGDPQVKGKIKERQRAQAMGRMMQNVPKADVVIRNPTHYAVALGYDADHQRAPIVLAKGADLVALRIVAVAEENNIAMVENKPLARGLYETVDLDREIPEEYYQPVAEVLAFVYSLKKKDLK